MGNYQAYEKYKDSGVEWLGEIPEHWELRRTKFLCEDIISGPFGSSLTKNMYVYSGYKIYGQEQVIANDFSIGDYYISSYKYREMSRYSVDEGDILVSCVGTFGKIAVVPKNAEKGIINPRLIKLTLNKSKISSHYFGLLLASDISFSQFDKLSRGGTMGVVNIGILSIIQLPIPPLDEQEQIANFLDRKTKQIDDLIAKKEALLAKLDEKRSAIISHAVTKGLDPTVPMKDSGVEWLGDIPEHWETKKIQHISRLKSGENITSQQLDKEGIYPVFGGNGLRGFFGSYTHDGQYILIGRQGALCGNINYASGKFWASDHAVVVHPCIKFNFFWLGSLLKTMNLNQYSTSAAQPGLSVEQIARLKLPFPPLNEQEAIAKYLDKKTAEIDLQKAKVQEAIERLKEYRTALITNAVTGKIDVRQVSLN